LTVPDFEQWDSYLNHVEEYAVMSESADIKATVIDAIGYLRTLFGEDWPRREWRKGHTLLRWLLGLSRWQRLWLIDLVKTIQQLLENGFGQELVTRLASSDKYPDAESEVIFAGRLMSLGAQVYPPETSGRKKTDFRAILEGREAFVEVANVRGSFEQRWAMRTFDEILNHQLRLMSKHPQLFFGGAIYRVLSEPHLQQVRKKISEAFEKVATGEKVVRIREDGVFEFDVFEQSARETDPSLRFGLQGPNFEPAGGSRISTKIAEEARQLPKGQPGFVALYDQNLTVLGLDSETSSQVWSEVCEATYDSSRVAGALVIATHQGARPEKEVQIFREFKVVTRTLYELLHEEYVLIPNRFSEHLPIAELLFARLELDGLGVTK
jgi:hypothetical protein